MDLYPLHLHVRDVERARAFPETCSGFRLDRVAREEQRVQRARRESRR